jgi:hypothetical protein
MADFGDNEEFPNPWRRNSGRQKLIGVLYSQSWVRLPTEVVDEDVEIPLQVSVLRVLLS